MKIKFTLLLFFIFLAVNNCATLKKQKYVAQSEILETDTTIQKPPVELPDISTAIETTAVQIAPTPKWDQYNSLLFFDMSMTTIYDDQYNDSNSLISAINYSLQYLNKLNDKSIVNFGADSFTINHLKESLIDFKEKLLLYDFTETFYEYVRENFCFYKSNADTVLFTGYYEPLLFGSFVKTDKYRYPLYRVPDNFYKIELAKYPFYSKFNGLPKVIRGRIQNKSILPFYTREEIDYKNALYGKDLEIVWCDNDIDVFFLHIQGSGIVQISDTQFIRVNYADQNGHQYKPIGKYLIDKGLVAREDMSMQTLKKYLVDHPEEKQEIFSYNPSYVFFRIVDTGPLGNIEVPLTPYRSIATDVRIFPKGALCFIETEKPIFNSDNEIIGWLPFKRFVMNQDTGGAIRGPARTDLFTGFGKISEQTAGMLKNPGNLWFLIKK